MGALLQHREPRSRWHVRSSRDGPVAAYRAVSGDLPKQCRPRSPAAPRQRPRLSSKRSLALRASNWVLSGPEASVSTPRWRSRSMTRWCCASCSVPVYPRPCAFRSGTKGRQCARVYDRDQRIYVDVSKPGGQQGRAPQGQPDHARAMRRCQQESALVRHHPSDAGSVGGDALANALTQDGRFGGSSRRSSEASVKAGSRRRRRRVGCHTPQTKMRL